MDEQVTSIRTAAGRLRQAQHGLARLSQAEVVGCLAKWAELWRDPGYGPRREAELLTVPFPFAMVQVSLDSLLQSLTPGALNELIAREGVRDAHGYALIGHVIAGNTPLLCWVSVIRALLMRSASLVKLPSGPASVWGRLFHQSMADAAPALAEAIFLAKWPGGTEACDAALCRSVDRLVAYGGEAALASLRALCPPGMLLDYGHRASLGLVTAGADPERAAAGLARDVLLYDGGGCLSAQCIFVEGDWGQTQEFAAILAGALEEASAQYPLPVRAAGVAAAVRGARALASMEEGTRVWEGSGLRWTVIGRPARSFVVSPGGSVVSVQPLDGLPSLPNALAPVRTALQGCALAAKQGEHETLATHADRLTALGVSYLCAPGQLQAPPLAWRQDGRDVLASLQPWMALGA